jgi:hypothetical protein
MAEISNSTLALLVLVTLGAVVVTTISTINSAQRYTNVVGFATSDTGNISLSINATLAIQVDPGNSTINFGTCAPRAGSSYTCATNDAVGCDALPSNCSGDTTTPQYIRIDNVGNVDANITIQSACTAAQLIGGTGPLLQYQTVNCNGTNTTSWTNIPTSAALVCSNLSYRGPGQLFLYANVTIPNNAAPSGCSGGVNVITFQGAQI